MAGDKHGPTIIKRKKVVAGGGHHGGAWKVAIIGPLYEVAHFTPGFFGIRDIRRGMRRHSDERAGMTRSAFWQVPINQVRLNKLLSRDRFFRQI